MTADIVRLAPGYRRYCCRRIVADRNNDGKAFRMLTVIDEHSREWRAIHVQRQLKSDDVPAVLTDLFAWYGPPAHIRSRNGAEFTANVVRGSLARITLEERLQRVLTLDREILNVIYIGQI